MIITLELLDCVCDRVVKTTGKDLPFKLRGITIHDELIQAALMALSESPQKTLAQNSANAAREKTPEGLDRRIKDYLDSDLRTGNIISDVLAEAGVVEITKIVNPKTGREIKATRLLDENCWVDVNHRLSDVTTSSEPGKRSGKRATAEPVCKDDYLKNANVRSFIDWLKTRMDRPGSFTHQYYLAGKKQYWECNSIFDAYENYWWPYNFVCPLKGTRLKGADFRDSFTYLCDVSITLREAVARNESGQARLACLAVLTWGGVTIRNKDIILNLGDSVCEYLSQARDRVELSTVQLGNHNGIIMNSGFTKIYSLLVDDFVMYDGRVGATMGLLARLYAEETGLETIPKEIEFSYGLGRVGGKGSEIANRRNPSNSQYILPGFGGRPHRQLDDNIKASWLLKKLADEDMSMFSNIPKKEVINERITSIQAALFMIGYDVSNGIKGSLR